MLKSGHWWVQRWVHLKRPRETPTFREHEAYPAFCAFRHFAQRAFCAALILASAAPDNLRRLRVVIETTFRPLAFAHLAR